MSEHKIKFFGTIGVMSLLMLLTFFITSGEGNIITGATTGYALVNSSLLFVFVVFVVLGLLCFMRYQEYTEKGSRRR